MILLNILIIQLGIKLRTSQYALLLALGFTLKKVKSFVFLELSALIFIGSIVGLYFGTQYNEIIVNSLNSIWSGAVWTDTLVVSVQIPALLKGFFTGVLISFLAVILSFSAKKLAKISSAQKGSQKYGMLSTRTLKILKFISWLSGISVLGLIVIQITNPDKTSQSLFFLIGGVVLIFFNSIVVLKISTFRQKADKMTLFTYAFSGLGKAPMRSLSIIAMLSIGVFLVFSTGAQRKDLKSGSNNKSSGTGGFEYYVESSVPILRDLNTQKTHGHFGFPDSFQQVSFFQMPFYPGDDASCLNLNQIESPGILGIPVSKFITRDAFSFATTMEKFKDEKPWNVLNRNFEKNTYPAIADQTVIKWGLQKKVGDTLNYIDDNGGLIKLVLIAGLNNSIFQGKLLVSDKVIKTHFPSVSGSGILLVEIGDTSYNKTFSDVFRDRLASYGLYIQNTAERLQMFNTVENTYLSIFIVLGGLGLIIGTIGFGIFIARSAIERKFELAVYKAVGFTQTKIQGILFIEYGLLYFFGLIAGLISSAIATYPSLASRFTNIPYSTILSILSYIVVSGIIIIYVVVKLNINKKVSFVLKNE
jgi:ABC-type antimicrobial peptide transport system permease subunit